MFDLSAASNKRLELLELAKEHRLQVDSEDFAAILDGIDPLSHFRDEFHIPVADNIPGADPTGRQVAYFSGNSIGLQPKQAKRLINEELQCWEERFSHLNANT